MLIMCSASLLIPMLWASITVFCYRDIRLFPGVIVYVQQLFFFVFIPLSTVIEGKVLMLLGANVATRNPWKTAIFANLADFVIRLLILR